MKLLLVCLCLVAAASAMKEGKPGKPGKGGKIKGKTLKSLHNLCSAYESGYADVMDLAFDDIFSEEMIGDFCDDFFAAINSTAKEVVRKVDAVKALTKTCKGFAQKKEAEEGPLVGFGAICNATKEAMAMSMSDKKSQKALRGLRAICTAGDSLWVKVSNFTEVFDLMEEDFCPEFMNSTLAMSERRKKKTDAVRMLGDACRWYAKKFAEVEPEGVLAELEPICDEYMEVKMALEEEEEDEEEEEEEDEEEEDEEEEGEPEMES